jgi:hypothetical protein
LLHVKKLYDDPVTEVYNAFGFMFSAGWVFHFKETLFFFVDTRLELRLYNNLMVSFLPSAGVIFRPYSREIRKKW